MSWQGGFPYEPKQSVGGTVYEIARDSLCFYHIWLLAHRHLEPRCEIYLDPADIKEALLLPHNVMDKLLSPLRTM